MSLPECVPAKRCVFVKEAAKYSRLLVMLKWQGEKKRGNKLSKYYTMIDLLTSVPASVVGIEGDVGGR